MTASVEEAVADQVPASPPVIVLHVGTMKSGTTYLQSRLEQHRGRLGDDGVLFPGPQWKDQMRAVGDMLTRAKEGQDLTSGEGRWGRLRNQLLAWDGPRAVVSVEHLGRASSTQSRALIESLRPARVEVILTVRELAKTIPSFWQQEIKAGRQESFEDFVAALADPARESDTLVRRFWKLHDVAVHAQRWAGVAGADAVRLVVVPSSGGEPDLLWQRFSEAAGLQADRYPAVDMDLRLNPSLGGAGAELLRRLNSRLGAELDQHKHRDLVKFTLANLTLAGQADDPPRRIPPEQAGWLSARSAKLVAGLRASGARIVGDVDDLVPAEQPPGNASSQDTPPSATALVDASIRATAALLQRLEVLLEAERQAGLDDERRARRQTRRAARTVAAEQAAADKAARQSARQAAQAAAATESTDVDIEDDEPESPDSGAQDGPNRTGSERNEIRAVRRKARRQTRHQAKQDAKQASKRSVLGEQVRAAQQRASQQLASQQPAEQPAQQPAEQPAEQSGHQPGRDPAPHQLDQNGPL